MKQRIYKKSIKRREAKKSKTPINKAKERTLKSYRLLNMDIKRLKRIASLKKATETRVITELIRLAYAGLFIPPMPQLNELYKTIVNEVESKETMNRDEKHKRRRK